MTADLFDAAAMNDENGDMLVDRHRPDPLTGRMEVERTGVRDSGFTTVAGYGEDGEPLRSDHHRMIVVAEPAVSPATSNAGLRR
ncbi:MAG TPA: hypothetical protein VES42_03460 [Pilimelia sp.]|nr:hypothetical protein [Pilimelia sp.]